MANNGWLFLYNNTSIKYQKAFQNSSGAPAGLVFVNNLLIGDPAFRDSSDKTEVVRSDTMYGGGAPTNLTWNYTGYNYDSSAGSGTIRGWQLGNLSYGQFADWQASSGQGAQDVLLEGETVFAGLNTATMTDGVLTTWREYQDPEILSFALDLNSSAIDAGAVVALVTDGYQGTLPDIGAWETNATPPVYGALFPETPDEGPSGEGEVPEPGPSENPEGTSGKRRIRIIAY